MRKPRLLCRKEVEYMTGFSRSHIYAEIAKGRFPKQHKFGINAVRWFEKDILNWMNKRWSVDCG